MIITLTQGFTAEIDEIDLPLVSGYAWYANKTGKGNNVYALACRGGSRILMHRLIVNADKSEHVDHIDGNGLNNKRENLRLCTHAENLRNRRLNKNNTSGYKGVRKRHSKWQAKIKVYGKEYHLGVFETAIDAALVYDEAAKQLHGNFASTNKDLGLL